MDGNLCQIVAWSLAAIRCVPAVPRLIGAARQWCRPLRGAWKDSLPYVGNDCLCIDANHSLIDQCEEPTSWTVPTIHTRPPEHPPPPGAIRSRARRDGTRAEHRTRNGLAQATEAIHGKAVAAVHSTGTVQGTAAAAVQPALTEIVYHIRCFSWGCDVSFTTTPGTTGPGSG